MFPSGINILPQIDISANQRMRQLTLTSSMSVPNDVQSDVVGWVGSNRELFKWLTPQTLLNMLLKPEEPIIASGSLQRPLIKFERASILHAQARKSLSTRQRGCSARWGRRRRRSSGSQRWAGRRDRRTPSAPARLLAEVLYERGQVGHDRQQHAAQRLNEKINSARRAQLLPQVCASESFGAGHEGPPDQSPLRSTRSDNHRRH